MKGNNISLQPEKKPKSDNTEIELLLDKLRSELCEELKKTDENLEDYYILRKVKEKVTIHVSKLGRSEIVKVKIKELQMLLKK